MKAPRSAPNPTLLVTSEMLLESHVVLNHPASNSGKSADPDATAKSTTSALVVQPDQKEFLDGLDPMVMMVWMASRVFLDKIMPQRPRQLLDASTVQPDLRVPLAQSEDPDPVVWKDALDVME